MWGSSGTRRYKETPWWNERIKAAVKRKNEAWREWFKNKTDENKEKWKRLSKAAKKMIRVCTETSMEQIC